MSSDSALDPKQVQITVGELTRMCDAAALKLKPGDPLRILLFNCSYAIKQLSDRLGFYEDKEDKRVQ